MIDLDLSGDLREHEGHQGAAHHDCVENVPEVSAVTPRVEDHAEVYDLESEI